MAQVNKNYEEKCSEFNKQYMAFGGDMTPERMKDIDEFADDLDNKYGEALNALAGNPSKLNR